MVKSEITIFTQKSDNKRKIIQNDSHIRSKMNKIIHVNNNLHKTGHQMNYTTIALFNKAPCQQQNYETPRFSRVTYQSNKTQVR